MEYIAGSSTIASLAGYVLVITKTHIKIDKSSNESQNLSFKKLKLNPQTVRIIHMKYIMNIYSVQVGSRVIIMSHHSPITESEFNQFLNINQNIIGTYSTLYKVYRMIDI